MHSYVVWVEQRFERRGCVICEKDDADYDDLAAYRQDGNGNSMDDTTNYNDQ